MSFFDLSSSCWRRCWRGTEEEAGTGEKARRRKVHCSDFGVKKNQQQSVVQRRHLALRRGLIVLCDNMILLPLPSLFE
jgi:hypothetical protein